MENANHVHAKLVLLFNVLYCSLVEFAEIRSTAVSNEWLACCFDRGTVVEIISWTIQKEGVKNTLTMFTTENSNIKYHKNTGWSSVKWFYLPFIPGPGIFKADLPIGIDE